MSDSQPTHSGDGYDRLASTYAWLEYASFGRGLMRTRTALLNKLPSADRILLLGDGDGRLLKHLGIHFPTSSILSIDISRRMLDLQKSRMRSPQNVEFMHADATDVRFNEASYDLVVTAFFLDCFTDSQQQPLLPDLVSAIRPGGYWYYADFSVPSSGPAKFRAQFWLALMHRFFQWQTDLQAQTLTDPDAQLRRLGMRRIEQRDTNFGLQTTRIYQRLAPSVDQTPMSSFHKSE